MDEGRRRLLMVFTGQGTQWAGCGRALYDAHPVFRRAVDAIEEHWREHSGTVICGTEPALRPVVEELERRNLQHRLLPGNIAFHSAAMDPLQEDAFAALAFLNDCGFDAAVPFVSSVTGAHTERLDNAYWWTNIRRRVRFAAALDTAVRDFRPDVVLEIAPHSALQSAIIQCLESSGSRAVCIPTLTRNSDVCLGFHEALGALFRAGVELDFAAQYPRPEPIAHLLPGYPRDEHTTADEMSDDEMFLQAGEYAHGPLIGHRVPCDHLLFEARMSERDFPWLAGGYSWSKLVAEQSVLFAQQAGLPAAIFRLPLTSRSTTGYTQPSDTSVRVYAAVADVQMMPGGFSFQRQHHTVDTLSRICTAIASNPKRQFTLYHCCNPNPIPHDLELADFGLYLREVPYDAFKRACQARGESSPLNGYWALFEKFAPYWFSSSKALTAVPVSDRAVREDCPFPIQWPGILTMFRRTNDWIREHRQQWPFTLPQPQIDYDRLMTRAELFAQRAGAPFELTCATTQSSPVSA